MWRLLSIIGGATAAIVLMGVTMAMAAESAESRFWQWFAKNESRLFDFERDQQRIFDELQAEMNRVHPGLEFLFGPQQDGRREFIISANGMRAAFPAVMALREVAPALERWTIIAFRPRLDPASHLAISGIDVAPEEVSVLAHDEGDVIGVVVFLPDRVLSDENTSLMFAFLFLDGLLGECDVAIKIGSIDVRPSSEATHPDVLPIVELPALVDRFFEDRDPGDAEVICH